MLGMNNARKICAQHLGAREDQIIFNSGSTEGTTTVFHSLLSEASATKTPYIFISNIEHPATHTTALSYEKQGFKVKFIPVNENGAIQISVFEQMVKEYRGQIAMAAVMASNNETGVLQPFEKIALICKDEKIPSFSDTTQYVGKLPFDFQKSQLDFAVLSGHKFGAMVGTGILLARDYRQVKPILLGGGQERNLRSGTQNYLGNETLAVALDAFAKKSNRIEILKHKKNDFEKKIKAAFPSVKIIGETVARLPGTTYLAYPKLFGQAIQIELESRDIFVSTSAACSDDKPITSRVLKAMKVDDATGRGGIRISLSIESNLEDSDSDYDKIYLALKDIYHKLLKINCF